MSMQATRQENLSAIRRFNDQRSMFRPMPGPIRFSPAYRPLFTKVRIVPATYHYRREVFYAHYNYIPPPYVYRMYPVYGVWDSTFLSFMLDHINEQQYALMYYNHQNEDAMQQWRAELDQMAVDNGDLKAQLAAMDTKMASLQGTPIDPSYVPEDAQDIALAPEVIDQAIGQSDAGLVVCNPVRSYCHLRYLQDCYLTRKGGEQSPPFFSCQASIKSCLCKKRLRMRMQIWVSARFEARRRSLLYVGASGP